MKASVQVRPCNPTDCADVIQLWKDADATPSITDSVEELRRTIAGGNAIVLVAIDDAGKIVGSVIGGWDGWRGNIYRLAVAPSARRHGIAAMLVNEVSSRLAIEKGARRITALVEKAHPHATGFWDSMKSDGYELDPRLIRYIKTL
ncbi:MAG TPA: GNAT family N-acetyltransferase [Candidatus Binataceae bacterium]|nr:GNAT family N-acetyltransferase [Candidatus Binataceae bacterium]